MFHRLLSMIFAALTPILRRHGYERRTSLLLANHITHTTRTSPN